MFVFIDIIHKRDKYTKELKDELWNRDLAVKTLREESEGLERQVNEKEIMLQQYKSEVRDKRLFIYYNFVNMSLFLCV